MKKTTSNEIAMSSNTDTQVAIQVNQNNVPTLGEMIEACDLTAVRHPDAVAFEKAPATGDESL